MTTAELKQWYASFFAQFEPRLNGESRGFAASRRKEALQSFTELPLPTVKDEEWKYTNLAPLFGHRFRPAFTVPHTVTAGEAGQFFFPEEGLSRLVFVNGVLSDELSIFPSEKGITVSSLKKAMKEVPELTNTYLGTVVPAGATPFTALNTAYFEDGAFIHLKKGTVLQHPVHIVYITAADEELFTVPRNLFIAEEGSDAKLVESYVALSGKPSFTNTVTEVVLQRRAFLEHVKLQDELDASFHISYTEAKQQEGSHYAAYNVTFGGAIVRNNLHSRLNGSGAECTMKGLYVVDGSQLVDNHTLIDHATPNCLSNELYKGVLSGNSRGVFNGKVMVRKDAQKTNAYQQNKNILLSNEARVDTKPQLEIFADDVKCTHGATIGQLDADALFYLRSRGLGEQLAKATLIFAFASDVVHNIRIPSLRDQLETKIAEKLHSDWRE